MKQLKLTMALLAAGLMMVSCNKDDDGGSQAALEGKWIYSKEGVAGGGQEILDDYEHSEGCAKDYTEIIAGGTVKDVWYYGSECTEDIEESTWTREGNTVTVGTGEDADQFEILNLTDTELKIATEYEGASFITVFTRG